MATLSLFNKTFKWKRTSLLVLLFSFQFGSLISAIAQQVPDTSYRFPIRQAAYEKGKGPVILIDEAHHNFHTRNGGFLPFARLMEQDGYRVKSLDRRLTDPDMLNGCKNLKDCHQGALLNSGKGKVAVFGEAAMFTAQVVNGNFRVGFNSELAPQNAQFALNLVHWLDGIHAYHIPTTKKKMK